MNNLGPGDLEVVTELEHHSNFVPWQYIAKRTGAGFRMIHVNADGELDLGDLDAIAAEGQVKVVANNLVSNALGTINPVEKLADWAHQQGAIMVVDGAQAATHHPLDVQALGCDFLAICSFNLAEIHRDAVWQVFESEGVAIRAGHHCCQPLMTRLGVAATNRASFYLYTVPEEIDRLVDGLHKTQKILG